VFLAPKGKKFNELFPGQFVRRRRRRFTGAQFFDQLLLGSDELAEPL
jgi:hypothetical protein